MQSCSACVACAAGGNLAATLVWTLFVLAVLSNPEVAGGMHGWQWQEVGHAQSNVRHNSRLTSPALIAGDLVCQRKSERMRRVALKQQ